MEWFKHDSNANLDEKLQEVLLDYGLEGYGLYWYCIELIVGKVSSENITFELKHDARIIARNTNSTVQKVEEMMKRFVDVGLFENQEGRITCMKVARRLMTSATSNPKMRGLIQDIKINHLKPTDTSIDTMIQPSSCHRHDGVMQDKNRIDKKDKTDIKPSRAVALVVDDFDVFWKAYPKKSGTDAAKKSWNKLKPNITEVLNALQWQRKSEQWQKNGGQYIPNPATYLNQGRWKDEPPVEELW
jgi:hypothetical protein